MQRASIIMPPPLAHDPHHRELAMGMREVWVCALYAAGADLFAPHRPLDPELDPFVAIRGERGVSLAHDERPPSGRIDAFVLSELQHGVDGWRLPIRIVERARSMTVLPGRAHRGPSAVLDVMVRALYEIGIALALEVPNELGWRNLLSVHSIAEGLGTLATAGREQIRISDPLPPKLLQ